MSLNIVDTLMDKLFLPSKGKDIPLSRKFTGTQNFLGTNSNLSQSIPIEFQQSFLDNEYFTLAHNKMNRSCSLDSKMNFFHNFERSNHTLVSRVSKLFSPILASQDCFRVLPNYSEAIRAHELLLNRSFNIFCEEIELHVQNMKESLDSQFKTDKGTCHQPNLSSGVESTLKQTMTPDKTAPLAMTDTLQETKKQLVDNNQAMNQELTNRKTKELQKRSRKRRRRQKKNSHVGPDKECVVGARKLEPKSENKVHASTSWAKPCLNTLPDNESSNSDILCDIVTIADNASSVQILLPNLSSFVISVESAEDDSDWDNNSDCEWLTDCSEFEFSGLFVANLSAPVTTTLPKNVCISQIGDSSSPDDLEIRQLGAVLHRVNKNWIKAMKGLDTKPKLASKVSFAPDDELVEIIHVDIYERKGEWETYATERMRFKRRINELEKIISPCLSKAHRAKIFLRFQQSNLLQL